MPVAYFEVHEGLAPGTRLEIPEGQDDIVLGRSPDCGIIVAASSVSRKHARLRRSGEGFLIEDLGSANGTSVNGSPLSGATALRDQDRVSFGAIQATFIAPPPPLPPPAPESDATIAVPPASKPGAVTVPLSAEAPAAAPDASRKPEVRPEPKPAPASAASSRTPTTALSTPAAPPERPHAGATPATPAELATIAVASFLAVFGVGWLLLRWL